ncbi:MAG: HlyD family secretion protein [Bacillota bacterium]
MRKTIFLTLLICCSLLLFTTGCSSDDQLSATGTIQGKEVVLTARIPAQVKGILVEEGQLIKENEDLVLLDDAELKIALKQAQANLEMSEARLKEAVNGSRSEEINKGVAAIQQIEASLDGLQAQLLNQENNIARQQELLQAGAIPQQQLDDFITQRDVLLSQIKNMEKNKEQASWQLEILKNGVRPETLKTLEAQVENASAALELAQYKLGYGLIKSPINGIINSVIVEEGENIVVGSKIVSILDPQELWVRVYLPEDVIGQVSVGQQISLMVDSFPGRIFSGKVSDIADYAQFTPRNVQTKDQRTTMVFPVKVKILEGFELLKIGMPADVYFKSGEKGENP